jgi:hypothetical protein
MHAPQPLLVHGAGHGRGARAAQYPSTPPSTSPSRIYVDSSGCTAGCTADTRAAQYPSRYPSHRLCMIRAFSRGVGVVGVERGDTGNGNGLKDGKGRWGGRRRREGGREGGGDEEGRSVAEIIAGARAAPHAPQNRDKVKRVLISRDDEVKVIEDGIHSAAKKLGVP